MLAKTALIPKLILLPWFLLAGPLGAQVIKNVYEPHLSFPGTGTEFGRRGDWAGFSVDWAGDVNRDGITDLIVGAPCSSEFRSNGGMVTLYSGKDGVRLWRAPGMLDESLGYSVAGAGDVNADGYPDVIAGAPTARFGAGSAFVYSGKDGSLLWQFDGVRQNGQSSGETFGRTVAGPGDVNQDGFSDLLVGAPYAGSFRQGIAYVYSGKDGTTIWDSSSLGLSFSGGDYVAGAGDVNLDGFPDFIVNRRVYSGRDGSLLFLLFAGIYEVAAVGDVNLDGIPDFMGAERERGSVAVVSGVDGKVLLRFTGGPNDQFGAAVAGAGDVDLDGYPDLLVGAPDAINAQGLEVGIVYTYSGRTGAEILALEGERKDARFGKDLAGAGNLNGDEFPDVLVGAPDGPDGLGVRGAGFAAAFVTKVALARAGTVSVPGTGNIVPILGTGDELPRLGNSSFKIEMTRAMGGAPVLIAASTAKANTVLDGLTLYGDFLTPGNFWTWSMPATGIPEILANGTATVAVPIPTDPTLVGLRTYWQGFVMDHRSPLPIGVSHTTGLEVVVVR